MQNLQPKIKSRIFIISTIIIQTNKQTNISCFFFIPSKIYIKYLFNMGNWENTFNISLFKVKRRKRKEEEFIFFFSLVYFL